MKKAFRMLGFLCLLAVVNTCSAQSAPSQDQAPPSTGASQPEGHAYSGMYSFLKDGEFVQITVEDGGRLTGFISRYGEGESDKGAFLDQFFKTGKLDGNNLSFTTEIVHGVAFDFKGSVQRGEGKTAQDEGYYVLKGTLTQNTGDVNNKVSARAREVVLKSFPQDAAPAATPRK
ncbi:MAG: hypothetical protein ACJ713_11705 [Candidatus Sulfotelmatobacter sp.]